MEITVTGRHLDLSEAMERYAREKIARLPRLYDRIETVDVICDREAQRFRTEVVVRVDHKHTFVAQVTADEYKESVDLVLDKMERQLREHKEKIRNRKHSVPTEPGAEAAGGAME